MPFLLNFKHLFVCARAWVCVRVCACVCTCARGHTHALHIHKHTYTSHSVELGGQLLGVGSFLPPMGLGIEFRLSSLVAVSYFAC